MKRAIVCLMIIGVVLMSVMATEPVAPSTEVELNFSAADLEKFNIQFTNEAVKDMATAISVGGETKITMTAKDQGATEVSKDFNLVWYLYSVDGLTVDITVGPMKSGTADIIAWKVDSVVDGTNKSGTENTAGNKTISAPNTDVAGTPQQIVTVASSTEGKMKQSYGNVSLSGKATLDNAKPGTYISEITTTVTAQ